MTRQLPNSTDAQRATLMAILALAFGALVEPILAQLEADEAPSAAEGVDYRVYDRTGGMASLADVVAAADRSEVLLVGEEHDDMPGHAFEAALLQRSIGAIRGRTIVLSLEMFERDVQYILDEYLADLITETHFLRSARPWDDYEARYRPLVEAAKRHGAPVVAANAPRRYVNRVTRSGPEALESLSDLAKAQLPPLPYPGPSERYRAEWEALMAAAMRDADVPADEAESEHAAAEREVDDALADGDSTGLQPDHAASSNAIYSQALWDASMGHAITTALVDHLGALVVHFAGSFHVERGTGIQERVEDYRPGTRVTTVVITKADDIGAWSDEDHAGLADFVVLTPKPAEAAASSRY